MKCYVCKKAQMTQSEQERDLDGVATVVHKILTCPKCNEVGVGVQNPAGLAKSVAHSLATLERPLTVTELVWLRKFLGASATDWAKYIGVTKNTLSTWENDHKPYPKGMRELIRLAALSPPMIWPYQERSNVKGKPQKIRLLQNPAKQFVRTG